MHEDAKKAYKTDAKVFLDVTYNTCRKWPYIVYILPI